MRCDDFEYEYQTSKRTAASDYHLDRPPRHGEDAWDAKVVLRAPHLQKLGEHDVGDQPHKDSGNSIDDPPQVGGQPRSTTVQQIQESIWSCQAIHAHDIGKLEKDDKDDRKLDNFIGTLKRGVEEATCDDIDIQVVLDNSSSMSEEERENLRKGLLNFMEEEIIEEEPIKFNFQFIQWNSE